ncbi:MAG: hypothetical protein H0Z29_01435 [Candidatus Marinimicrobia bacterium]|nr:hypothetical protein [Candidatus Neomarinimicrobiota bacterium]
MNKFRRIIIGVLVLIQACLYSSKLFSQGRIYEGPDDPAGDRSAVRMGVMDGNQFLTVFFNNTQIGYKYMVDGSKWPRDSEKGIQVFDVLAVLLGAQVFVENDSIPVTDLSEIMARKDLDSLYFIETYWNYEDMLDRNPEGDIVWGLYPVPGYFNPLSESPAISNDPFSWPPEGWPARGDEKKWPGEWNGRFGRGVKYAQLECCFVANDAQDQEYLTPGRRIKYYPRPGVFIGDKNPNVTIQKGKPWGGVGYRVEVRGYQWENPQTRNVIFWEYNITNISDYDIPRAIFGFFVDMGVGNAFNVWDDGDDLGGFEESMELAYVWDSNNMGAGGYAPGTCGIAFLESPGIYNDGIDNDEDGLVDERRDNVATKKVGPYDGISDLSKFLSYYGKKEEDLKEHWDADEDQDWQDGIDLNGNGVYDIGEYAGDDVGLDGVGPGDINYTGPDPDGTECNHKPDMVIGINSEPNFGINDVSESDMLGLTSFHFIPWPFTNPPCPRFDEDLYKLVADRNLVKYTGPPSDYAPVFGSGPFVLSKGTTERISCALMAAYEDVASLNSGDPPYLLMEQKKVVQMIYENDYRFAKPPEMSTLHATALDGKVILYWDDRAEKLTREPLLGGENDFEGYKLYKSTDRFFSDASRVRDAFGNVSGKVPIFQCDLKNDYYGFTDYALVNGESFFLGRNTGIRHYYIDEDVENGRTYYYYITAYDHGIQGLGVDIAPSETVPSIVVDENEEIVYMSPNVQVVTPHPLASGYIPPSIELNSPDIIKGTGEISFDVVSQTDLKPNHVYKLSFKVDTIRVFGKEGKGYPLGIFYRNIGYTIYDTIEKKILVEESPEHYTGNNIQYDMVGRFYHINSELVESDFFDGIIFRATNIPVEARLDSSRIGWISGDSPIEITVSENAYKLFPWQYDIVFTGGAEQYTTISNDFKSMYSVEGITLFDRSLILPATFDFYVENKLFRDSTGSFYKLDLVAYDANKNGQFDILEDYVIAGYASNEDGEYKWMVSLFAFNFRQANSEENLPKAGDVYRIDGVRPFTADDVYYFEILPPSEEEVSKAEDLDKIKVVPNPYIVTNLLEPAVRNIYLNQRRRIMFTNIPSQCEIKIFTISGYLVDEFEVNNEHSNGIAYWDLLTKEGMEIAPGVYVYYIKSKKTGKVKTGKFAVIK